MSERVLDNDAALVRRLAARLNRKVSDLFFLLLSQKGAGSLGALAGLAFAVLFTWKFFRSPPARRRAPPKSRESTSTSQDINILNVLDSGAESTLPSECNAAELTLGQIVRKKLNGSRKITCQLLGVILEERSPEDLQKHATFRLPVVDIVFELAKSCDLYLMETVLNDESEVGMDGLQLAFDMLLSNGKDHLFSLKPVC